MMNRLRTKIQNELRMKKELTEKGNEAAEY